MTAALLALAGCSESEPTAQPTASSSPSASPTPAVERDQSYATPEELIAALERGGYACSDYSQVANPKDALTRGQCQHEGREIVVSTYASHTEAAAYPSMVRELIRKTSHTITVVGPNWTLLCHTTTDCDSAWRVLGGELVQYSKD